MFLYRICWQLAFPYYFQYMFVAAPRTRFSVLQSTMTALPYANYETEVLNCLLLIATCMWAVAKKASCLMNDNCPSAAYASSWDARIGLSSQHGFRGFDESLLANFTLPNRSSWQRSWTTRPPDNHHVEAFFRSDKLFIQYQFDTITLGC